MVKPVELEELIALLAKLRIEMEWACRAEEPIPPDVPEAERESWKKRAQDGAKKAPQVRDEIIKKVESINWQTLEFEFKYKRPKELRHGILP